jgi:hypothetical protein
MDYMAGLASSNVFEPTSDVIMLFLRGIYQKHTPYALWKHTCPFPGAVLLVTHDVDCSSAFDTMSAFTETETEAGVRAHYFITTHYFDDPPRMSAFYDNKSIRLCAEAFAAGHEIGSHSVAHIPDFSESYIPAGSLGNTTDNYHPLCPVDTTIAYFFSAAGFYLVLCFAAPRFSGLATDECELCQFFKFLSFGCAQGIIYRSHLPMAEGAGLSFAMAFFYLSSLFLNFLNSLSLKFWNSTQKEVISLLWLSVYFFMIIR